MIITISDDRKFNKSVEFIGYIEENKATTIEFEFPDYLKNLSKKINFRLKDDTEICKLFNDINSNKFTFTRDLLKYDELQMSISFFNIENEDEILYRTNILNILIDDSIVCDDDVSEDDPKVIILNELIQKVTELDTQVAENEASRISNEETRVANENTRINNENAREEYIKDLKKDVELGNLDGATFTPSVSENGDLSWSNNKGLVNPQTINIRGPEGKEGKKGIQGEPGVGITTVTSGQSIQQDGNTVTPITVNKTDGTQQTFNISAKNGIDGQNGTDGIDGITPSLRIGTVTTLEPNEQATVTRTGTDEEPLFNFGIPKGQQGEKGQDGTNGTDGKDATINGQNTVEITTDNTITLDQQESVLKLGLNSQLIPKQNTEGTDNTFEDGLNMNLFALGGDGKSEQVVTTGKNNLNNTLISQTLNGLNIQINKDKSVKIQGTANKNTNIVLNPKPEINTGTYTLYGCRAFIESEENNGWWNAETTPIAKTFTTKPTLSSQGFFIYIENGQTVNKTYYQMLLKGTYTNENIGDYEPYTGGQPSPSPDYEQPINSIEGSLEFDCTGKNLLPVTIENETKHGITITNNKNGTITINGTADAGLDFNIVQNITLPQGRYTNSSNIIKKGIYFSFDNIGDTMLNGAQLNYTKTFTISEEKTYSRYFIYIDKGTSFNNETFELMVERGTEKTNYEPYVQPNEVTFNLGQEKLRSVGDVKDELVVDLDTGDYYKVENIEEVTLTGQESNWFHYSPADGTEVNTYPVAQYFPGVRLTNINAISDKFLGVSANTIYTEDNESIAISETQMIIRINKSLANSAEAFKQWLSTHNTIVDYVLQKPTTKKLGTLSAEDLAKLKTFKGYNNVTVNTNLGLMNIRFTYGLDVKKYVDNKIAELSAQLIKGE